MTARKKEGEGRFVDTGLYVNLFEVRFEDRDVDCVVVDRSRYLKLRDLRQQLAEGQI